MIEELIIRFKQDPEFDRWLEEVKKARPLVPTYKHKNDNTEEWKYYSAKREGFDLVLQFLKIKPEDLI